MYDFKSLLETIKLSINEYQSMIDNYKTPKKEPKQPRDFQKIKDFLFKKIF